MNSTYQLLIFDWDGTLMDSMYRITQSIQAAAEDTGFPIPAASQIRSGIGLGPMESLQHIFPKLTLNDLQLIYEAYKKHYFGSQDETVTLYPGTLATLQQLRTDYQFAVATGKSRAGLDLALQAHNLQDLFLTTRTADETSSKPNPQMIEEILTELGVEPVQALMIGDTEYDIQLAENAGIDALVVSYGAASRDRLQQFNPLDIIDDITELVAWLQQH